MSKSGSCAAGIEWFISSLRNRGPMFASGLANLENAGGVGDVPTHDVVENGVGDSVCTRASGQVGWVEIGRNPSEAKFMTRPRPMAKVLLFFCFSCLSLFLLACKCIFTVDFTLRRSIGILARNLTTYETFYCFP